MQLHIKSPTQFKKQQGAFLVIALILLIILSALGIASMSATSTSSRISVNYSQFMDAEDKAQSMAQYAKRILASYPDGVYPGPATCNSSGTCNVIDSNFPQSGRPTLAWDSGLSGATMYGASQSNTWWTTNGFAYEGTFAGSGNARVVVSLLGAETVFPYKHTYRIVGYATDNAGNVKATYQLFHVWKGYRPDPYPTTTGTNLYNSSACSGGCPYGQCCDGATCAASNAVCSSATDTFVPPGWLCNDYFVTGLGYSSSACTNTTAEILDVFQYTKPAEVEAEAWYKANGVWPTASDAGTLSYDQTYTNNSLGSIYVFGCDQYTTSHAIYSEFASTVTGQTNAGIVFYSQINNGAVEWLCRQGGSTLPSMAVLPPYCGISTASAGICDCTSCGGPVIVP
jgi:Tfp pilus assembly protein PilX